MKIVIFGATGKIGQELIPYIVQHDPCIDIIAVGHRKENIFGFSNFETRTEGNSKQSKIFFDFSNIKPKIASKANQS